MKYRTIAGWTAAFTVAAALTGTTAAAEPAALSCPVSALCLFEHSNYQGVRVVIYGGLQKGQCYTLPRDIDSAVNRTSRDQYAYPDSHCFGLPIRLCPNGCAVPAFTAVIGKPIGSVSG